MVKCVLKDKSNEKEIDRNRHPAALHARSPHWLLNENSSKETEICIQNCVTSHIFGDYWPRTCKPPCQSRSIHDKASNRFSRSITRNFQSRRRLGLSLENSRNAFGYGWCPKTRVYYAGTPKSGREIVNDQRRSTSSHPLRHPMCRV